MEAEFGEETVGVFRKDAVERAKEQYLYSYRELNLWEREQYKKAGYDVDKIIYTPEYTRENPAPKARRIVGVDWDKFANDTQIVITEFDEMLKKFRVAKRYEIPRGEFTFDNAVNKLIEIDEIWNPDYFYIDAGYGEYQIEALRKHGRDTRGSTLDKKVKRIQFSQVFEIVDPATKEIDKKDAKNFMVNQTSIVLERDQIVLSPFDDMIWKQMMDYQVIRITQSGKPQYTSENEHALDCLMLTMLGFTLEFPSLVKILEEAHYARYAKAKKVNVEDSIRDKLFKGEREVFQSEKPKQFEAKDNPNWRLEKVTLGYTKRKKGAFSRTGRAPGGFKRSMF